MTVLPPVCLKCKHLKRGRECDAFAEIPDAIWLRQQCTTNRSKATTAFSSSPGPTASQTDDLSHLDPSAAPSTAG